VQIFSLAHLYISRERICPPTAIRELAAEQVANDQPEVGGSFEARRTEHGREASQCFDANVLIPPLTDPAKKLRPI